MKILEQIHSSADVKALTREETRALCGELREAIIDNVSHTGGHLGSNLGAVELTVALHRVYDTSRDRLVFDVGHQCYAHKMLTGRLSGFPTLRRLGGLSGFPKPRESGDDPAVAGHASTSVSNALGMARARTLLGENYDVVAVIGDGALTGGLAYEGLSDCGGSGESIVVVLNDNEMSIDRNVGGIARLLERQRVRPGYIALKKFYHRTVGRVDFLYRVLHTVKEWVKDLFLPDNMFEDMGFYYLGPLDGHDVVTLERTLAYAREMRCPVLVHVCTVKGKGYPPAEAEPALYHGVSGFDRGKGVCREEKTCFSTVFGAALREEGEKDRRVVAITAAMEDGTGLGQFRRVFPDRFFDVGIAEGHAVSLAAGMASRGLKPVFAVYSSFLQRAFDMMIHDVSLSGLPVVFAVDRCGLVGADGETHQGSFDVGYLSQVPGMKIFSPSSYAELRSMLSQALAADGPAAVRYPRGAEGAFTGDSSAAAACVLREGGDVAVVSYGILINEALAAADALAEKGISARIIKLNRLDDPDYALLAAAVRACGGRLVVAEETAASGGMGDRLLSGLCRAGVSLTGVRLLNLGNGVVEQGSVRELWKKCGIDGASIAAAAEELYEKSKA
ncbi:MAG: 1-deoxy-D-xylulose-5-phosphate synthase [Oscillospiraceae bacterium]